MSPSPKIDSAELTAVLRKCNGSWVQKTLVAVLTANIVVIIFCVGQLMVNHRLLQDSLIEQKQMQTTDKEIESLATRIDKDLARTQVTVAGHEIRITSLEAMRRSDHN